MHKYILKRFLMLIPVLLGVVFIMFCLQEVTPGDPAIIILGEAAHPDDVAQLRYELGLDNPFLVRFGTYVFNMVQGDFGLGWSRRRLPVFEEIITRFPNTLRLASIGVGFALLMGIPLGILSATKQYTIFDTGATFLALIGVSIPNFWLGLLLMMLFTMTLGWFPASGFDTWQQHVMPVIAIGTGAAALVMRMTRSSMLEALRQDYIRTARAKGQVERLVIFRHALRNALIPVTTTAGLSFGFLLGGAVLAETVFAINGVGRFMVDAIMTRDWPIAIGGVTLIAVSFSLVNLFVDILYAFLDPRIRSQYR